MTHRREILFASAFAALLASACTIQPADAPPPDARPVPLPSQGSAGPAPTTPQNPGDTAPKPAPAPVSQPTPERSCPELDCKEDCPHGYLHDARGCPSCLCAPPPAEPSGRAGGGTSGRTGGGGPASACACQSDADCVKVQDAGCCGCNAGGEELAVAKACLDRVPKCTKRDVMCPQVYQCTERKAACEASRCVLK